MRGSDSTPLTDSRLSIFVPHGATKLTDHELNGDGLAQWAVILELARRGHRLTIVTPAASIAGSVPENIDIHVVPDGDRMSVFGYMIKAYAAFSRCARSRRFDVIHQMNPVVRGVTIPWLFSKIPVVLGTYVGDWPYQVPRYRIERTGNALLWLTMAVKVGADATQQFLAARLLVATRFALNRIAFPRSVARKIVEVPHGIDVDHYSPFPQNDDPISRPLSVLFVGLLEPHKGVAVLLQAFDKVRVELPSARLVVIGDGPMRQTIARYAHLGGWTAQVELIGAVPHSKIAGWIRACSVVCSAALGEPFGQTIVEAIACGCPVIVNDCGGPPHIVSGTDNPVVRLGDADSLARAIVRVLTDDALRSSLSRQNRTLAETRFAWPRVVDELEKVYRSAVEERKRAAL